MQVVKKLIDKSFSLKQSPDYWLNVQVHKHSLTYAVFNPQKQQYLSLFHAEKTASAPLLFEPFFEQDPILIQGYARINVLLEAQQQTLLPEKLVDVHRLKEYAQLNFAEPQGTLLHDFLPLLDARLLYSITDTTLLTNIRTHFGAAILYCEGSIFIEALLRQYALTNTTALFIDINQHANCLRLAYLKGSKLCFYNTFSFESTEEFCYYPLLLAEQFDLDRAQIPVVLSGTLAADDPKFQSLQQYFSQLSYARPAKNLSFSKALEKLPAHHFYTLFATPLCG